MNNFRKFKYIVVDEIAPRICSSMEKHTDIARGDKVTRRPDSLGWI
jgi:hypothetical protein